MSESQPIRTVLFVYKDGRTREAEFYARIFPEPLLHQGEIDPKEHGILTRYFRCVTFDDTDPLIYEESHTERTYYVEDNEEIIRRIKALRSPHEPGA